MMDVGWTAAINNIYLSPSYLEPDRYGLGFFHVELDEPTASFEITHNHARAILAAAQTQLANTTLEEPQEVSHSPYS